MFLHRSSPGWCWLLVTRGGESPGSLSMERDFLSLFRLTTRSSLATGRSMVGQRVLLVAGELQRGWNIELTKGFLYFLQALTGAQSKW